MVIFNSYVKLPEGKFAVIDLPKWFAELSECQRFTIIYLPKFKRYGALKQSIVFWEVTRKLAPASGERDRDKQNT